MTNKQDPAVAAANKAKHYVNWHAHAYETPAPTDEVLTQMVTQGLTRPQAKRLLAELIAQGQLRESQKSGIFDGLLPAASLAA